MRGKEKAAQDRPEGRLWFESMDGASVLTLFEASYCSSRKPDGTDFISEDGKAPDMPMSFAISAASERHAMDVGLLAMSGGLRAVRRITRSERRACSIARRDLSAEVSSIYGSNLICIDFIDVRAGVFVGQVLSAKPAVWLEAANIAAGIAFCGQSAEDLPDLGGIGRTEILTIAARMSAMDAEKAARGLNGHTGGSDAQEGE